MKNYNLLAIIPLFLSCTQAQASDGGTAVEVMTPPAAETTPTSAPEQQPTTPAIPDAQQSAESTTASTVATAAPATTSPQPTEAAAVSTTTATMPATAPVSETAVAPSVWKAVWKSGPLGYVQSGSFKTAVSTVTDTSTVTLKDGTYVGSAPLSYTSQGRVAPYTGYFIKTSDNKCVVALGGTDPRLTLGSLVKYADLYSSATSFGVSIVGSAYMGTAPNGCTLSPATSMVALIAALVPTNTVSNPPASAMPSPTPTTASPMLATAPVQQPSTPATSNAQQPVSPMTVPTPTNASENPVFVVSGSYIKGINGGALQLQPTTQRSAASVTPATLVKLNTHEGGKYHIVAKLASGTCVQTSGTSSYITQGLVEGSSVFVAFMVTPNLMNIAGGAPAVPSASCTGTSTFKLAALWK